jgi:broad specificity phosphatase PhoE
VTDAPDGRIALVRHARSSHVHTGWIDAAGFRAWREAYEAAGIHEDELVPADLKQLVARADLVLSSDAPRAVASARLLAPEREIIISPLLRELDLHALDLGRLRLPLAAWALAVGLRTLLSTLRQQYPSAAEAARISSAATWLEELSAQHPLIVAVTHASYRQRLSSRLVQTSWLAEPGRRSLRHWSTWLFKRRPATYDPNRQPNITPAS